MAATRTPGMMIHADSGYFIDKRHHGTRFCLRRDRTTIEQAELRLKREVAHVQQTHNATLPSFVSARIAAGASAMTINRRLEVVRAIPLITALPESRRSPYPVTWDEQACFGGCRRICSACRCLW